MSQAFDYRQRLLHAIDAFLEGTAEAVSRGRDLVRACPKTVAYTINDLIWGSLRAKLADPVIYEDTEYLRYVRPFLTGESRELRRGAICYDFRWAMHDQERAYLDMLKATQALLERYPDPAAEAFAEYAQQYAYFQEQAQQMRALLPHYDHIGDETVYRLVLREVDTAIMHMDMRYAMQLAQALATKRLVQGPLVGIYQSHVYDVPDANGWVQWSKKALAAIVGKDWLYLTWQLQGDVLLLSIH